MAFQAFKMPQMESMDKIKEFDDKIAEKLKLERDFSSSEQSNPRSKRRSKR